MNLKSKILSSIAAVALVAGGLFAAPNPVAALSSACGGPGEQVCGPIISIVVTTDAGDPTLVHLAFNGPNGKAYPLKAGEVVRWIVDSQDTGWTLMGDSGITTTVRVTCDQLFSRSPDAGYWSVNASVIHTDANTEESMSTDLIGIIGKSVFDSLSPSERAGNLPKCPGPVSPQTGLAPVVRSSISIAATIDPSDPTLIRLAANGPDGAAYPLRTAESVVWSIRPGRPDTTLLSSDASGLTATLRTTCSSLSAGPFLDAGVGTDGNTWSKTFDFSEEIYPAYCPEIPAPSTDTLVVPSASPSATTVAPIEPTVSPVMSAPAPVAPTNSGSDLLWVFLLILGLLLSLFLFWLDRRRKAPPA